jgi:hypothetical protein
MRNDSDNQRVEASVNSPLFWLGEYPPPHPCRSAHLQYQITKSPHRLILTFPSQPTAFANKKALTPYEVKAFSIL